jgi:hypothetical protein
MKKLTRLLLVLGLAVATTLVPRAQATLYMVNRSFTEGSSIATLTGTLDIPNGNYTIQNSSASPFTAVNLTLTVNGTPYILASALTNLIYGTGQFFINATPTRLTFQTANGDSGDGADLTFSETTSPISPRYIIGYDGSPGFEAAYIVEGGAGSVVASVTFPVVFGNAVPEPHTAMLLSLSLLGMLAVLQRRK